MTDAERSHAFKVYTLAMLGVLYADILTIAKQQQDRHQRTVKNSVWTRFAHGDA